MTLARAPKQTAPLRSGSWFEKLMALVVLINLLLGIYDLSYTQLRDTYLRYIPNSVNEVITIPYGEHIKGIQPERFTVAYLALVDQLKQQVAQNGLSSSVVQELLPELSQQSDAMIDENPFEVAGKSGNLERIKNLLRDRVRIDASDSAKEAFEQFWSTSYLKPENWDQEIAFFDTQIRPLMTTNYYRSIGEDGRPTNLFFEIDIWFIGLFSVELIARSFYLSRRYQNLDWFDAVLLRWYDLLLIWPFLIFPSLHLVRVIPTAIRVNQSGVINLEPLRKRISRILISQFVLELTEIIVLRVIEQFQNLVRDGVVTNWVMSPDKRYQYVDLNEVNELQAIAKRLLSVAFYETLPQVKPEVDALLHHSLNNALTLSPAYQSAKTLPGIGDLIEQVSKQIVAEVSRNTYDALIHSLNDSEGEALAAKVVASFTQAFKQELQKDTTVQELEALTVAFLEEVKANYSVYHSDEVYLW